MWSTWKKLLALTLSLVTAFLTWTTDFSKNGAAVDDEDFTDERDTEGSAAVMPVSTPDGLLTGTSE